MRVACSQISARSAVLPIPAGPEISTLALVPCWQAPRSADSALAIGSLRPRNGPDRTAPPQETAYLLARVTGAAPPCIARSGDVQSAVGGHAGQLDPRLDSRTRRNCGEGGRLRCAVIRTGIRRSPGWSCRCRHSRCRTTASQSRRTGLCGRAAPWRPWRSSARRAAAGILACSASLIRSCRKASRSPDSARMPASTSFADRHYQLWNGQPAGSGELRDREPPPRPMSSDPFGRTGHSAQPGRHLFSPTRAARRSSTSVARPDSVTTMPSSSRPWENSTSGERVAVSLLDLCAACADLNVLT